MGSAAKCPKLKLGLSKNLLVLSKNRFKLVDPKPFRSATRYRSPNPPAIIACNDLVTRGPSIVHKTPIFFLSMTYQPVGNTSLKGESSCIRVQHPNFNRNNSMNFHAPQAKQDVAEIIKYQFADLGYSYSNTGDEIDNPAIHGHNLYFAHCLIILASVILIRLFYSISK